LQTNYFMKRYITIILLFIAIGAHSQSNRQYLGLSIGPAFPLSDLAKTNFSDSTSGFAKTGVNFKFVYSYKILHNFGIEANFVFNSFNVDINSFKDELNVAEPEYSFSVESNKPWSTGGIYLGPFLRLPITERFTWDLRALVGLTGGYSPQFTVRSTKLDNGDKSEYFRETARTFGLGFAAGTGFKYNIGKYTLMLNADYYFASFKFQDVTGWGWTSEDNITGTPYSINTEQKVSSIAVSFGIAYFL